MEKKYLSKDDTEDENKIYGEPIVTIVGLILPKLSIKKYRPQGMKVEQPSTPINPTSPEKSS